MKTHTMQEWADFLGVALVKNNYREKHDPPGIFHRLEVTPFMCKPEIVPQHYGKPCWVDITSRKRDIENGEIPLGVEHIIGGDLWQLVSDLEQVPDFVIIEPDDYGDKFPCLPMSGSSIKQMEIADALKPAHPNGNNVYSKGDPIDMLETRSQETTIEQIEKKYKEKCV